MRFLKTEKYLTEKYLTNFMRNLGDKKQAKTKQEYIEEAIKRYNSKVDKT